jgi:hypothetical protein
VWRKKYIDVDHMNTVIVEARVDRRKKDHAQRRPALRRSDRRCGRAAVLV